MGLGAAVAGGGDADVFPGQRHVLPGNQLRAVDVQVAARAQGDVAVNGADGAAAMRGVLRGVSDLQALLAVAETNAARAGEARFFLLSLMALLVVLFRRGQGQVVACRQVDIVIANDITALNKQIIVCLQYHGVAAEQGTLCGLTVDHIVGGHGLFRQRAAAAGGFMVRLKLAAFSGGRDGNITARTHAELVTRLDVGCLRVHVASGYHRNVASPGDLASHLLRDGLLQPVVFIPRQVIAGRGGNGRQVQIPPGVKHRLAVAAAVHHLRPGQAEIAPGV